MIPCRYDSSAPSSVLPALTTQAVGMLLVILHREIFYPRDARNAQAQSLLSKDGRLDAMLSVTRPYCD